MGILDIVFLIPIVWLVYKGFSKGLIIELATLAALILGIYASLHFSHFAANLLKEHFDLNSKFVGILAFIITFVLVVIAVNLLGKLLEKVVSMASLGFINKGFGGFLGLLKAVIFLSFSIYFINKLDKNRNLISPALASDSKLYTPIEKVAPYLMGVYKDFDNEENILDKAKSKAEETYNSVVN
jgi:membrane protein required for colicin V production